MDAESTDLQLVADFLKAYYHDEPSNAGAATQALLALREPSAWRARVADAFQHVLEQPPTGGVLTRLVREAANRYVRDDEEAKEFLQVVYDYCLLEFYHDD